MSDKIRTAARRHRGISNTRNPYELRSGKEDLSNDVCSNHD